MPPSCLVDAALAMKLATEGQSSPTAAAAASIPEPEVNIDDFLTPNSSPVLAQRKSIAFNEASIAAAVKARSESPLQTQSPSTSSNSRSQSVRFASVPIVNPAPPSSIQPPAPPQPKDIERREPSIVVSSSSTEKEPLSIQGKCFDAPKCGAFLTLHWLLI